LKENERNFYHSERFNIHQEIGLLDTFYPDNDTRVKRIKDRWGDYCWVVGEAKPVYSGGREICGGWMWVVREKDNVLMGLHKSSIIK